MNTNDVLRSAFLTAYRATSPALPLASIAHWAASVDKHLLNTARLNSHVAYLSGGFYFQTSSNITGDFPINEEYKLAKKSQSDWLLFPSVEMDCVLKIKKQFSCVTLKFFSAAEFRIGKNLDDSLRAVIGGKRYRELMRLVRKNDIYLDTYFFRLDECVKNFNLMRRISSALNENIHKYGHTVNPYSYDTLCLLGNSNLGNQYLVKLSTIKGASVETAIHVSLSFLDTKVGVMYQLTQGQFEKETPHGLNVYLTDYYILYKFGHEIGINIQNLGRGAIDLKKKIGANYFCDLYNVLIPITYKDIDQFSNYDILKTDTVLDT